MFILGDETGILYPHKMLIGQTEEFHLVIEARDGEGPTALSDRAIINIQVLNVNEHKPTFVLPALANATVEVTEVLTPKQYVRANKFIIYFTSERCHGRLFSYDREGSRQGCWRKRSHYLSL